MQKPSAAVPSTQPLSAPQPSRDEIIKKELPLDMLEFFVLTPLPGSEDHKILAEKGVWMDPDMNKYELEHVVTAHPRMSKEEWQGLCRSAWEIFYADEHLETVMRRAYACGISLSSLMPVLFWFSVAVPVENLHPLQWGIFRIKRRRDRRPGLPIEPLIPFYLRYADDVARKVVILAVPAGASRRSSLEVAPCSGFAERRVAHKAASNHHAPGFLSAVHNLE